MFLIKDNRFSKTKNPKKVNLVLFLYNVLLYKKLSNFPKNPFVYSNLRSINLIYLYLNYFSLFSSL